MTGPAPTLEYSIQPYPLWRRHRRLLVTLASLLLITSIGYALRAPILRRAEELYWSRKCLAFSSPRETPLSIGVWDQLARKHRDYDMPESIPPRTTPFHPECWREMERLCRLGWHNNRETAFLGELRTPSGKRRIVHVLNIGANALTLPEHLIPTVIEPATLTYAPRVLFRPPALYAVSERFVPTILRFGQRDPVDRSHFTIEFEVRDPLADKPEMLLRRGIIDGFLGDDDRIAFRLRDPASTRAR